MALFKRKTITLIETEKELFLLNYSENKINIYVYNNFKWQNSGFGILYTTKNKTLPAQPDHIYPGKDQVKILSDLHVGKFLFLVNSFKSGRITETKIVGPIIKVWELKEGSESIIM